MDTLLLTINGGSSSLKFALFRAGRPPSRLSSGKIERIGLPGSVLTVADLSTGKTERRAVDAPDHASCVPVLVGLVEERVRFDAIGAIGHRVVHGGARYAAPERVTPEVLDELRRLSPLDPEHLPAEIGLIEVFAARHPSLPQVACFDTAFHHDMPRVAKLLPIPRRYDARGVRRYGFHGLSYAFLMKELARLRGPAAARGRVILAHLGNGASLAAVHGGKPVDTSMAFTPTAGLVMSTRSGDLDPGVVVYFARTEGMTPEQFHRMVNAQSGLLGVSETSSDVRDLLEREPTDGRAAEALALFCYQVKKWIGAFAAALGGVDTLVFSGGIGENASTIRSRICEGLGFLGITLDAARNGASESVVSAEGSRAVVCVIRTDEELEIADAVCTALRLGVS
ncbi:MAG: acetate/propionate family kinase [Candidatus Rokubacteria bacterium]|nr:acetate/propionate family kinase [Candidatus Rokubacteria bacterium]